MYASGVILGKKYTVWHNPTVTTVTLTIQRPNTVRRLRDPIGESAHIPHEYEPEIPQVQAGARQDGELFDDGERWPDDRRRSVVEMLSDMAPPSHLSPEVATMMNVARGFAFINLPARPNSRAAVGG